MAADLFTNPDGANFQAQAVLAYLRARSGIEQSWNDERHQYDAEPKISRWENCREQGYIVWMRGVGYSGQINIAFFEHRNSDNICAIEWEQTTTNAPTIDTMDTGNKVYKDKWDVSYSVGPGSASDLADWIFDRLTAFWLASVNKARTAKVAS